MALPRLTVWVVVTDPDGRILLGRRTRGTFAGRRILISGGVDEGERFTDAALREVREETGLTVEVGPVEICALNAPATGQNKLPHEIHVYRAKTVGRQTPVVLADGDIEDLRFYAREELPRDDMSELTREALRRALS